MRVSDIMKHDVLTIDPWCTIAEVAQTIREWDIGAIPVVSDGQFVGMITDRDIVVRVVANGLDPHMEQAQHHLTSNPLTIGPDARVDEAAELMIANEIRRLPVVADGRLVGYLSLSDLAGLSRDLVSGQHDED